jgi:4-hydroxybenzoate polyprenyltransferase
MFADLLTLARPAHCLKSLLVVPLAALQPAAWEPRALGRLGWAIVAFALASALVYVVNDIADRSRDRLHPEKRNRPVAAGRVSVPQAVVFAALLTILLAVLLDTALPGRWWPVIGYLALNVAYTFRLKHVPLVDALTVAAGFALRVVAGYLAIGAPVAGWLPICVFSACLVMTLRKRSAELAGPGIAHRPALHGYSTRLVELLMLLTAGLTAVSYFLYASTALSFDRGASTMLITAPCAIYGLFRYLQVALVDGGGDPVRLLLRDRSMLLNGVLWAVLLLGASALAGRE